jgi:hypothetical protein
VDTRKLGEVHHRIGVILLRTCEKCFGPVHLC